MASASRIIGRLIEETREHHAASDLVHERLFRSDVTSTYYLAFLVRVYGFQAPVDAMISETPLLDRLLDLPSRARATLLTRDLIALGLHASQILDLPQCLAVPQFRGAAEALGWMYVVERTALAHSMVRQELTHKLPHEMRCASAYLRANTGRVQARWQELGAVLDDIGAHPAVADRMISSAREAFRQQQRWIGQGETHALLSIA